MADIAVPYERQKTDSDLTEIVDRGDDGVSVLGQLGTKYQNLPDHEMATIAALVQSLKGKTTAYQGHITAIVQLLIEMDADGAALDALNKGLLPLLRGALRGKAEEALLDRITGPTEQGSPATPPNP